MALPCPKGTARSAEEGRDLAACTFVLPGFFSPTQSILPSPCAAGSYTDRPGQGASTMCSAGRFQSSSGATGCEECQPGASKNCFFAM